MNASKSEMVTKNILFLLVLLLPAALLTGPFIPDLLVSLITLIFLFFTISKRKWKYFQNKFFVFFLIFYIYFLFRSILSSDPLLSLQSSLFYFRFGIFALAIWYLLDNKKSFIKYFSIFLFSSFVFALFDGYYQYLFGVNLFGYHGEGVRISLPFNDDMILGGYLVRLFPLLIGIYLFKKNLSKKQLITLGIMFILTDVLIFVTGERTALLLLLISSVFILFLISKYRLLRLFTLLISLFILFIIAFNDENIKTRNVDQTFQQLGLNQDKIIMFSNRHESHFKSAFLMFQENPLFGVGPKMFRSICDDEKYEIDKWSCSTHPHNTYFQLLAETGLVGILFILIPVFILSKQVLLQIANKFRKKKLPLSDYQICIIAAVFVTLWPIAPTQNFFNNWISIIYYLPVGFILHSFYKKEE